MNEWPWWAQLISYTVNGVIIFVAAYLGARAAFMQDRVGTYKRLRKITREIREDMTDIDKRRESSTRD